MIYVGIDVAKDKHDCFICNSDGEILFNACTTKDIPESNGLLTKCTYHWDDGANECCPWGDYYYLEALMRLKKDWKKYW